MTHGSVPEERALLGIGDHMIRLSIRVEEGEDLVRDIRAWHCADCVLEETA
jgi:cystathionine beta-lyase/cystathionine gamma-synthase